LRNDFEKAQLAHKSSDSSSFGCYYSHSSFVNSSQNEEKRNEGLPDWDSNQGQAEGKEAHI